MKLAPGTALALGKYHPSDTPPDGSPVKVGRAVAARAEYIGAMYLHPDYGVLAVFKDHETRLCYAQPVED